KQQEKIYSGSPGKETPFPFVSSRPGLCCFLSISMMSLGKKLINDHQYKHPETDIVGISFRVNRQQPGCNRNDSFNPVKSPVPVTDHPGPNRNHSTHGRYQDPTELPEVSINHQ